MLRLTGTIALFMALLVSAADAQRDRGSRDRGSGDRIRDRGDFSDRIQFRDRGQRRDRDDDDDREFRRDRRDFGGFRDSFGDRSRDRSDFRGLPPTLYLGEKEVLFRQESDTIEVNQPEDWFRNVWFRSLIFRVHDNNIDFRKIRISFIDRNAPAEEYEINQVIQQGRAAVVRLRSPISFISRIEMTYASDPNNQNRATVTVLGELDRRPIPSVSRRDAWVPIGWCKEVQVFGRDRDAISGHGEGNFRAIRLHVRRAPLEMEDLKVTYREGGFSEDLPVPRFLSPNEPPVEIPLHPQGQWSRIHELVMTYRSLITPSDIVLGYRIRRPEVCVEGLKSVRDLPPEIPPQ